MNRTEAPPLVNLVGLKYRRNQLQCPECARMVTALLVVKGVLRCGACHAAEAKEKG